MFRVTEFVLPSVQVPPADSGGGFGTSQYFPGGFSEFGELTLTFIVDEQMINYEELFRWITQQRYSVGKDFVPKGDSEVLLVSDGSLNIFSNSSTPNRTIHFKNLFPVDLSSVQFETTTTPEPVKCTATFRFSHFTINPIQVT